MPQNSEPTLGEQRVRINFNPGDKTLVDQIKRMTADLIDLCHEQQDSSDNMEVHRCYALAMTHFEDAAMWAVKGATG
jgi:hypothetical protein